MYWTAFVVGDIRRRKAFVVILVIKKCHANLAAPLTLAPRPSSFIACISYAVGEWARIWPLQTLVRAMGAYFVRRDSRDPLYRKVLER